MKVSKLIGTSAAAALLALAMGNSAIADPGNGNGPNGPRASIGVVTTCALSYDRTKLFATSYVTNQSSGNVEPFVTGSTFNGLAKNTTGNWGKQWPFDTAYGDFTGGVPYVQAINAGHVDPDTYEFIAGLDLCEIPDYVLDKVKAVNVMATIFYQDGMVQNMCGDNPDTIDVIEPDGIALTAYDIAAIRRNCPDLPY